MKKSVIFKSIFFLCICLCSFLICGSIAFNLRVHPTKSAPSEKIPKQSEYKEPLGILVFDDERPGGVVLFLDFNSCVTHIILLKDKSEASDLAYTLNRQIKINKTALKEIIDFSGGIILESNGSTLRYTGNQVCKLIYEDNECDLVQIIPQIISAAAQKADKEFYLFLINNTSSNISYIDFFNCKDSLPDTLSNCVITEEE